MGHVFDQYNHLMHQEPVVIFLFFSEKTQILVEKLDVLTQTVLVLKSSFSGFMTQEEKSKKVISNVLDHSILYKDNLNLMNLKHKFPAKLAKFL